VDVDRVVGLLRRGASVALVAERDPGARRRLLRSIANAMAEIGRTTLWIDLEGAASGAELGARIVEACMAELDPEELGDLLERLPSRGRIDMEAFAELLMLPETVATGQGRRVVAILDGFEAVERVIGFAGLGVVRDALLVRDRASYLFVGSARVAALFGRPQMPLYGLAEVVQAADAERSASTASAEVAAPPADADPLAAALLGWAEAPAQPTKREAGDRLVAAREMPSAAELAWEAFLAQERRSRRRDRWWERDDDEDDDPFRRRRRRR
jgi:hypothetical protein